MTGLLLPTPILPQLTKEHAPSPVKALILVVINAILEVFFLCLVGYILARRGIVDPKAKKTLNKINVTLFTPALLFSKVAFSLTPDKLKDLIIIPIGFVIISIFSASTAWLFGRLFRLKRGQRNFAIACATFQNSNSLPIALMQSLIGENMPLHWGSDDNKDKMLGRALSYLVLFSTLGIIVRWSVGVRLLTSAENDQDESGIDQRVLLTHGGDGDGDGEIRLGSDGEEDEVNPTGVTSSPFHHHHSHSNQRKARSRNGTGGSTNGGGLLIKIDDPSQPPPHPHSNSHHRQTALLRQTPSGTRNGSRVPTSFPNTPRTSTHTSINGSEGSDLDDDEEGDDEEEGEWGARTGGSGGVWRERLRGVERRTKKVWKPVQKVLKKVGEFMTVPLWAALLSLVVACIPPLQHVLNEAEPLKAAIRNAGNCSVPITLVTLGAYFYRPSSPLFASAPSTPNPHATFFSRLNPFPFPSSPSTTTTETDLRRERQKIGEGKTVAVAVITRMIIVPLVLLPLFGWYAAKTVNIADDPVFVVVACLLIGSPTAITLAQITSSASGDTFEKLISKTLFVSYAIMTAPTTIALVLAALYIDRKQ